MTDIGQIPGAFSSSRPPRAHPASHQSRTAEAAVRTGLIEPSDRAEFSDYAQLLSRLATLPEIRVEKVATVRAHLEAGTYETSDKLEIAVQRALHDVHDVRE